MSVAPHQAYMSRLEHYLQHMLAAQTGAIERAARLVAQRVQADGILHTFGSGHSSLVAAEPSYRAGGLATVNFLGLLPGSHGWIAATDSENDARPAARLIAEGGVRPGDVVAIVSHSGQSNLVRGVNDHARRAGAETLAFTASVANPLGSGVTIALETGAPADDCAMTSPVHPYGSISSILTLMLLNAVIAGAVGELIEAGRQPSVLESIHAEGGREHNERVMAVLASRVPCWKRIQCVS